MSNCVHFTGIQDRFIGDALIFFQFFADTNDGIDIVRGEMGELDVIQNKVKQTFDKDPLFALMVRTRRRRISVDLQALIPAMLLPETANIHRLRTNEQLEELNFRLQ